MGWTPIKIDI